TLKQVNDHIKEGLIFYLSDLIQVFVQVKLEHILPIQTIVFGEYYMKRELLRENMQLQKIIFFQT
ncbi:MAG: hypothetical protein K0R90_1829, partial [Oscillospiraceae bacterium]|nr:hypothetical protein [Oscillospiraceae bacterium]